MSKDLIPQPRKGSFLKAAIRSLSPNAAWDAIKNAPTVFAWIVGGGTVIGTAVTSLIQRLQGIPQDVLGISLIALLWLLVLTVVYSVNWYKRRRNPQPVSESSEKPLLENEKSVEELNDQIRRLQDNNTALEIDINLRRQESEQYAWLREIAGAQALAIHEYVIIEAVRVINPHDPTPSLNLYFYIRNRSNYHVTIDDKIEGALKFEGRPLTYPHMVVGNELKECPPLEHGVLTVKQPLRPEEVEHISTFGDMVGYYFSVSELQITVRGGANFPQVIPQRLSTKEIVPELPVNVKDLKDRIKQLEAEKAAKAKPDITGQIKGVYCETWANAKLGDDGRVCFDYHFIVNAFVANRGAVTTIEQYKLVLRVGEQTYNGEREKDAYDVDDEERDWRRWGAGELDDLEKSNDLPLEHSRTGSLWFVVTGVPNTEAKAAMELELYAVDKGGTSYKLDAAQQSQWERNPFYHKALVAAQRTKMKQMF